MHQFLNIRRSRFYVTRKLTNWDSDFLTGRIHALCQSLNYRGRVEVTFPVHHQRIVLKSSASLGSAFRSAFSGTEKHEVEVYWPYATHPPVVDDDSDQGANRRCLVRGETGWFKDWKPVLRSAILAKKHGWCGIDDWIEVAMRPPVVEAAPSPWGEGR
jgi:hypothetical protein